jgi:hypothetical protein
MPKPSSSAPTTSASGGSTVVSTGSCGNFVVAGQSFPNCATAGVPTGTPLKKLTSPGPTGDGNSTVTEVRTNGAVISGVDLTGSFDVYANNVTIENSIIRATNWWGINQRAGFSGLRVLHCLIIGVPGAGPNNGAEDYGVVSSGGTAEVGWSDVSGFGDALAMGTGDLHDNYVHDLAIFIPADAKTYNHDDDVISNGGSGLTVTHNTLLNQVPVDKGASAAIGLYNDFSAITDVNISDNFIAGGAYAVYPGGSNSSSIAVTRNVFSVTYWPGTGFYGPVDSSDWHSGAGNQWSTNVWADGSKAGQAISP